MPTHDPLRTRTLPRGEGAEAPSPRTPHPRNRLHGQRTSSAPRALALARCVAAAAPPLQSSPNKWSMRSSSVCRRTATTGTRGSSATQLPFLCGLAAFGGGGAFLPEPPPFGLPAAGDRDFGLACRRGDDLVGVWLGSSRAGAFADRRGISMGKKRRDETRLVARERFCETGRCTVAHNVIAGGVVACRR